nr:immunoglobulin heavy chain junction region [Macaca mulatta]
CARDYTSGWGFDYW